jgi:hypothetical protein
VYKEKPQKPINLRIIFVACVISLSLNILLSVKYVYANHTFTEEQVMINLGKIADNKYVFGEYENGYSLYNNIKPVLNTYTKIGHYMENDEAEYYFDYYIDDKSFPLYFSNVVFKDSEYTVTPVAVFQRNFKTFGQARSVALYRKIKKTSLSP